MSRKFVAAVSAVVVGASLSVWGQGVASSLPAAGTAAAATPELSVTTRLSDRREVAAGTRAYSIGFEDGRFYANGWHITGEMGGVWTPPLKLLDGVWFGLDGQWVGPATKFSSGWGYTRYDLPNTAGLQVARTDFVPDGRRGALFGLTITNPGAARTAKLSVDAHSELMGQYPWGFTGVTPNASDNLPDMGTFNGQDLAFTDDGALPGAPAHHYAALVGTSMKPDTGVIGPQFYGPQPGHRCTGTEPGAPADPKPSACDDGPFGNGTGGELTYTVNLPTNGSQTVWLGVAGSDQGGANQDLGPAQQELSQLLRPCPGRWPPRSPPARSSRSGRNSRCPATRWCRTRSTGASRTWPTSRSARRTCRSAGPTRASSSQRRSGPCLMRRGSVPVTRTTRGSSAPTVSTPHLPRSRWASSRRSRTICAPSETSPTS